MLTIHSLNVAYGDSQVLWDVGLRVPQGQVVCLLGRNGVGKTTLLKSIMGLLTLRSGSITLHEQELSTLPSDARARCGIGYVPQGRDIFPDLTVQENLRIGLVARGVGGKHIAEEIFQRFPVLKTMLARKGGLLSGGQQQQLAIARALVTEPTMLLLDEPTEGIQPSIILDIEEAIHRLKQEGRMGILLVEQYLDFARRLADYVYVMDQGRIVLEGKLQELEEDMVRRYLAI
ncbi:MAG: urea ABC transporter ATP-binding subunit UrtE [Candidatus Tectomicrobia bacterium]|uniref:Urea ABC transporter ATP-binding subunit UrtE n=1 Tax=Tectimicrobiota bacterium TaxID=2528274 RepID=A0A937VYH4_UNCTE|nr:urea ABC transporter ATP-binding subunit UrtE [Candidatus Tectomicrobia bacterium]